jgi:hypothetical protein
MRRNDKESQKVPTMERDEGMDHQLHKGMCNMSAKQNHDAPEENAPIPNHDGMRYAPL